MAYICDANNTLANISRKDRYYNHAYFFVSSFRSIMRRIKAI